MKEYFLIFLCFIVYKLPLGRGECNTMIFNSEISDKALTMFVFKTINNMEIRFCRAICYMNGNRCLSYNFDINSKTCELSESDHVMNPENLVPRSGSIYNSAKNKCKCSNHEICRYNFTSNTHRCECNANYAGSNCTTGEANSQSTTTTAPTSGDVTTQSTTTSTTTAGASATDSQASTSTKAETTASTTTQTPTTEPETTTTTTFTSTTASTTTQTPTTEPETTTTTTTTSTTESTTVQTPTTEPETTTTTTTTPTTESTTTQTPTTEPETTTTTTTTSTTGSTTTQTPTTEPETTTTTTTTQTTESTTTQTPTTEPETTTTTPTTGSTTTQTPTTEPETTTTTPTTDCQIDFPRKSTEDYVAISSALSQEVTSFTLNFWLKPSSLYDKILQVFSYYSDSSKSSALSVAIKEDGVAEIMIGGGSVSLQSKLNRDDTWQNFIIVWKNTIDKVKLFKNGLKRATSSGISTGTKVETGGTMYLGQMHPEDGFDDSKLMRGSIADLEIWNVPITNDATASYIYNLNCQSASSFNPGQILTWESILKATFSGGVVKACPSTCKKP